jgi:hypothetical protein
MGVPLAPVIGIRRKWEQEEKAQGAAGERHGF